MAKLNLGILKTFTYRALPTWNAAILMLVWIGIPAQGNWLLLPLGMLAVFIVFDVLLIYRQENAFAFRMNPEFQEKVDRLLRNQEVLYTLIQHDQKQRAKALKILDPPRRTGIK